MTQKIHCPTTSPPLANIFMRSSPKKPAAMIAAKLAYKMCPNHRSSVCSFACLVESHKVLIQELTSQLADHPNLETPLADRRLSRYSTYQVSSPLSPKDESFWKVAAKEIFKLGELGEKERREVLEFVFREDKACFRAANTGITSVHHLAGLQKEFMEWHVEF
ncbi:hypothetical protein C366_04004 [Cryptococcus neoformans Tu401-1]|nr:hypothetical protein C365_06443 [Cryptococcus neoformans var. grubii Bt85]OXG15416.1 hypothetical protein C366_04004 [Cryptococcus neoformans var. grubii Tu401-1]